MQPFCRSRGVCNPQPCLLLIVPYCGCANCGCSMLSLARRLASACVPAPLCCRYPYKFIMDGVWSYDADKWLVADGDNVNNVVEVLPRDASPEATAARQRLLTTGGLLTEDELKAIRDQLGLH